MQGVITRLLEPSERGLKSSEPSTPWVVEARQRPDIEHLRATLSTHTDLVLRRAAQHGAVLFRGFDLESDSDFENTVLSIREMQGMASVFMSERGRTLVPGARFVMHTNSIYTTGGSFDLPCFHTENYFVPDVPRFVFFFCRYPSLLGGETGLVNTAKVFRSLPEATQARLRQRAYLAGSYPVDEVRARYGLSEAGLQQRARERGLVIESYGGQRHLNLYKPSVLIHPETGEPGLDIDYHSALMGHGMRRAIHRAFLPDYAGPEWAIHRMLWDRPALTHFVPSLSMVRAPGVVFRDFVGTMQERAKAKLGIDRQRDSSEPAGVQSAFEPDDAVRIAEATRAHFSSFRWRSGDLLMIDNLKMAHAGMPGFGPRLLRTMLCNPIALPLSAGGSGDWAVPSAPVPRTVGDELSQAA